MKLFEKFWKKSGEFTLYQNGLAKEINASSSVFTDFLNTYKNIYVYMFISFSNIN